MLAEVAAMSRIVEHPNVCGLISHFYHHNKLCIVMEACTGGDLFDCVQRAHWQLSEEQAQRLGREMVAGVAHIHSEGVAHRDIKLENFLLSTPDGKVKISDLGLAHVYERLPGGAVAASKLTGPAGSKCYMAPEIVAQKPYDGFRADIWSLGVCVFLMCAGFFPFEVAHRKDWRFQLVYIAQLEGRSTVETIFGTYGRQCHFTPALAELLDAMLQIDPSCRISTAGIAGSPWLTFDASL